MKYSNKLANHEVIKDLKERGYDVFIIHQRPNNGRTVVQNRGCTVVKLTSPNKEVFVGESICHKNDMFNKKRGVRIALGRALKSIEKQESEKHLTNIAQKLLS